MSPDKSPQNLFNEALERPDANERARFLADACGADAALRERVARLLRAHDEAGGFLFEPSKHSLSVQATGPNAIHLAERPGDRIGRYKLLQHIGEGGCGAVYMAEQEEPVRRRVALKVIKLGMDTKQVIARFEAERQALALMDHPNIARVLEAGATDSGRPYFAMELVRGSKITEFCDQNNLSTEDRLKLFNQVCHAIQHAHQKGVIHRDIKPSNILVTVNDGVPVPKVIDFGIAKATQGRLTDQTLFTAFEQFIGTPAYMSPEQAVLTSLDIDTRSDIYSLGVLLYELLTGGPPFDQQELLAAGLDEMRRTIREKEPPRPSNRLSTMAAAALTTAALHRHTEPPKLIHIVRGDLDWIAMKCLEKDRAHRYETANALAADIRRHLDCEPVLARPPSRWYEFQKTVRRHKFGFAAAGAVMMALAIGFAISTWQFVQKNRAYHATRAAEWEQSRLREIAEAKEKQSQQVAKFLKDMLEGVGPSVARGRDTTILREVLDKTADGLGDGLANQPAVEAELRQSIGDVYWAIGEYAKAEAMYRETLRLRTELGMDDQLEVAQSLSALAMAVWKEGNPAEAESLLRRSLEIRTRILPGEHPEMARCLFDLAEVLRHNGKGDETLALHRRSLEMRRKLFGNVHLEVADSLNRLGSMLSAMKDDGDEELLRESLAIRRQLRGDDHPEVAEALDNLAHTFHRRGNLTEAERMHREALAMRRKYYGREHSEIALSLLNLGTVLEMQDKLEEATAAFREAWEMRKTMLGYGERGRAFDELRRLLQHQGKCGEAEAVCRQELASTKASFGDVHREVDKTLAALAAVLQQDGRFAEAEAAWREELALEKKLSGEDHVFVANSLKNLATALLAQNKLSEAAELSRQAMELEHRLALKAALSSDPDALNAAAWFLATCEEPDLRDGKLALELAERAVQATNRRNPIYLDTLAAAYAEVGQFGVAAETEREAMALPEKTNHKNQWPYRLKLYLSDKPYRQPLLKDNAYNVATWLAWQAIIQLKQGKPADAEPVARACLMLREWSIPGSWMIFDARSLLGASLLGQKRYTEAEPFLVSGFEGMKRREADMLPRNSASMRNAIQRLVQLYEATGQPGKIAEWNTKLVEFDQANAEKQAATPNRQSENRP